MVRPLTFICVWFSAVTALSKYTWTKHNNNNVPNTLMVACGVEIIETINRKLTFLISKVHQYSDRIFILSVCFHFYSETAQYFSGTALLKKSNLPERIFQLQNK